MWLLLLESTRGWVRRTLALAALTGAVVAVWELAYQGRSWNELRTAFPWMLAGAAVAFELFEKRACRERRTVLLKTLPRTDVQVAMARLLAPLLLFLPPLLLTFLLALLTGALSNPGYLWALLGWALLLVSMHAVEMAWRQTRPWFSRRPLARFLHATTPFLVGGLVGGFAASRVLRDEDDTLLQLTGYLDARFCAWAAVVFVVFGSIAVRLFVRRQSHVEGAMT